jgi:hypothetical protein
MYGTFPSLTAQPLHDVTMLNPGDLTDRVASRTEWTFLPGGDECNFCTRTIRKLDEYRVEIRASWQFLTLAIVVLVGGLSIAGLAGQHLYRAMSSSHGPSFSTTLLIVCASGGAIAVAGCSLLRVCMRRVVVDKRHSLFWKGSPLLPVPRRANGSGGFVELERLYAIQILARYRQDEASGDYYQFQVNLVLDDGRRVLAFGHGGLPQIWQQGENLSRFLRIPVWGIATARRERGTSIFANSA